MLDASISLVITYLFTNQKFDKICMANFFITPV